MTTPMLVGFDVEPDGLNIPRHEMRRWTGFERSLELVTPLRDRLEKITSMPVHFSWYLRMDPQITDVYGSTTWVAETYGAELAALSDHGDELGLHPHALRWDSRADHWLTDVDSQAWVEDCVRRSFEAYERAFGRACRSHRFGDRFMSNAIVRLLRDLGVAVDLTLEPGRGPQSDPYVNSLIPDQTDVPRRPYHPDPSDFKRPTNDAGDDLWMFPLSSANPDPALPIWRRGGRRVRHVGQPLHRPVLLWAPWPSKVLWDIVTRDVESKALTVLPFMIRADTLLNDDWARQFEAHMAALAEHRLGREVVFTTPSAVADAIRS